MYDVDKAVASFEAVQRLVSSTVRRPALAELLASVVSDRPTPTRRVLLLSPRTVPVPGHTDDGGGEELRHPPRRTRAVAAPERAESVQGGDRQGVR